MLLVNQASFAVNTPSADAHMTCKACQTLLYGKTRHLASDAQTGFVRQQLRTLVGMECGHETEQGILV